MYRCKDCKTIYKNKVDYCDCGNNIFEEIPNEPAVVQTEVQEVETPALKPILPLNIMSIVVFSFCCLFSLCFVLFLGPAPAKRVKTPVKKEQTVVKNIPDINKIWDSTPAYTLQPAENTDLNLYKDGLRNALLSKLNLDLAEGSGSCDIQFVLDKHGNLKKKKLFQNTANKPLLDAAKKMLSAVKIYNAPPSSYDGLPLTLELKASGTDSYVLRYKD